MIHPPPELRISFRFHNVFRKTFLSTKNLFLQFDSHLLVVVDCVVDVVVVGVARVVVVVVVVEGVVDSVVVVDAVVAGVVVVTGKKEF